MMDIQKSSDDDMLRKAELLAAQMQGVDAPSLDQPSITTADTRISAKSSDNIIRETETLLPQMQGGPTPMGEIVDSENNFHCDNESMVVSDDDDDMLLRAEILAQQIKSSASVASRRSATSTPVQVPMLDHQSVDGVLPIDVMLLKAEALVAQMQPAATSRLPSKNDEHKIQTMQIQTSTKPPNEADSIDDMLRQALLLSNQMQLFSDKKTDKKVDTTELLHQSDATIHNARADPTVIYMDPSRLIPHSDSLLVDNDGQQPTDPPIDDILHQSKILLNTMKSASVTGDQSSVHSSSKPNHTMLSPETGTIIDSSLQQHSLGRMNIHTHTQREVPSLPPLVTPTSTHSEKDRCNDNVYNAKAESIPVNTTKQMERTEEMLHLMNQTISNWNKEKGSEQSGQPTTSALNNTLEETAALMEQTLASLKGTPPTTPIPSSILDRTSFFTGDDVSSVGSGSARSSSYDSPIGIPQLTSKQLVSGGGGGRFQSFPSRGDLPPLCPSKDPIDAAVYAAEEVARAMSKAIEETSIHSGEPIMEMTTKKQAHKHSMPPPPPQEKHAVPSPKINEEKEYASLVKKMEGTKGAMKWEKVTTANEIDEDYVPMVDYSKKTKITRGNDTKTTARFGKIAKGWSNGKHDDHVPMVDYSRPKKSQSSLVAAAALDQDSGMTAAQRYKRNHRRRRKKIARMFMACLACLLLVVFIKSMLREDKNAMDKTKVSQDITPDDHAIDHEYDDVVPNIPQAEYETEDISSYENDDTDYDTMEENESSLDDTFVREDEGEGANLFHDFGSFQEDSVLLDILEEDIFNDPHAYVDDVATDDFDYLDQLDIDLDGHIDDAANDDFDSLSQQDVHSEEVPDDHYVNVATVKKPPDDYHAHTVTGIFDDLVYQDKVDGKVSIGKAADPTQEPGNMLSGFLRSIRAVGLFGLLNTPLRFRSIAFV